MCLLFTTLFVELQSEQAAAHHTEKEQVTTQAKHDDTAMRLSVREKLLKSLDLSNCTPQCRNG